MIDLKRNPILKVVRRLYHNMMEHQITALGAQVAYNLFLSLFPFLIFLIASVSYANIVTEGMLAPISQLIPNSVYALMLDVLKNVAAASNTSFISIGMIGTVWSASSGVLSFMNGMNIVYGVKESRPVWRVRLLSVLFTVALAALIVVSILLVVFGEKIGIHIMHMLSISFPFDIYWDIFRYLFAGITMFFIFVLFYMYVPSCSLSLRDVTCGSLLATVGLIALSAGFSFYVNNFANYSKTYGSIGAVIALLIWLYWGSILIFIGSELNSVLYRGPGKPKCK